MSNVGQPVNHKYIFRVYINASQKIIWDAVTKAEWTQQYGYGWRMEYDLRPGGGFWVFTGEILKQSGAERGIKVPDLLCKGNVIEVDAPYRLGICWQMEIENQTSENSTTDLIYEIAEVHGGFSRLSLTLERRQAAKFPLIGSEAFASGLEGFNWRLILCDLKSLLETGKGFML